VLSSADTKIPRPELGKIFGEGRIWQEFRAPLVVWRAFSPNRLSRI
jgi:hypothetical protein